MAYKRRRDRWRKRPKSGSGRRSENARHRGPYMGVPRVSGSAEMGVSTAGELEEREPPSIWVRLGLVPVAFAAVAVVIGLIMTDFWFLLWVGLGLAIAVLIYQTWRRTA